MKKLLALLLALIMVFSMVACGAKEEAPAASEEKPAETKEETKEEPKEEAKEEAPAASEEKPVLKVAIQPDSSVTDMDDNAMTYYFEEQIGADIEWVYLPADVNDAVSKISLWSVDQSEDVPDVIMGGEIGRAHV